MSIRVTASPNNRKFEVQLQNISKLTKRASRQAFYKIGKDLLADSRASILERPKTGRTYVIYRNGRRRTHIASAPEEAPANLTGQLRRSIDFLVHGGGNEMEFGAETDYARALELGNPKGNLEPRPYLRPSIDGNNRNIIAHFEREIKKGITQA